MTQPVASEDRLRRMFAARVAVVMRGDDPEQVAGLARALAAGGFECVEVTLTVPGAIDLIKTLCADLPGTMIGAGTVTTAHDARAVIAAGAQFVVSPVAALDIIRPCREGGVVCIPAGMTPTEIHSAWLNGGHVVKVFPAAPAGGPAFLRALRGPFPEIPLWVSGGVTAADAPAYFAAGAQLVGLNANEIPADLIRAGAWDDVAARAADLKAAALA
jgi:2-dehydro-3-deoxyphosphogluconate aldolase/(4S)-4-hydroxy-2-oxoglutarate aldolase